MLNKIYSLIAVFSPVMLFAQPTINNIQNYAIGSVFKYYSCTPLPIGPSGAGQTWNFNSLTVADSSSTWILSPGSPFPAATFVEKNSDSTLYFIQKVGSANYYLGYIDSTSSGNGAIFTFIDTFMNGDISAERPLTMNTYYTSSYADANTNGSTYTYDGAVDTTIADAYGTLILPNNTYTNTIRVKTTKYDGRTVSLGGQQVSHQHYVEVIHSWYDDNHMSPLLVIDSIHYNSINTIKVTLQYLASEQDSSTSVSNISSQQNTPLSAFLNNEGFTIQGLQQEAYNISLFNALGQKVYKTNIIAGNSTEHIAFSNNLAPGIYFLRVSENDMPGINVIKVLKQ